MDVGFNKEVGQDGALYWNKDNNNLSDLINRCDEISYDKVIDLSNKAKERINEEYSWKKIIEKYELVFTEGK